jgi:hypothetical protein
MSEPTGTPAAPRRRATRDSAEHLFAAFPVLLAIANWTGKLGRIYIKNFILSGKLKEARRNAAIIASVIIVMFLIIFACVIWLAKL